MTTILLIRHGDTDWNVEEIFRGRADIELNKTGIKQAQLLAKYLEGVPVEAVYSSPLKRAIKTAEIIAGTHGADVIPSQELIDFDYGEWQGLCHDTVKEKYRTSYEKWLEKPHLAKIPKGESLNDVRKRAVSLVDQVIVGHEGTVAFVSHRVILKVIICALLGLDNSHFWNIKLDTLMDTFSEQIKGFAIIFLIAFIATLIRTIIYYSLPESDGWDDNGVEFSVGQFLQETKSGGLGRFILYISLFKFAVCLCSPLFAVYMVQYLKFSYTTFAIVLSAEYIARVVSAPL